MLVTTLCMCAKSEEVTVENRSTLVSFKSFNLPCADSMEAPGGVDPLRVYTLRILWLIHCIGNSCSTY